jgi:hypothetical protein
LDTWQVDFVAGEDMLVAFRTVARDADSVGGEGNCDPSSLAHPCDPGKDHLRTAAWAYEDGGDSVVEVEDHRKIPYSHMEEEHKAAHPAVPWDYRDYALAFCLKGMRSGLLSCYC